MALRPIASAISAIPWATVIDNAPKVAEGAARLWKSIGQRKGEVVPPSVDPEEAAAAAAGPSGVDIEIAALTGRLVQLEAAIEDGRKQLADASGIISELAQQNARLVEQIEAQRARLQAQVYGAWGVGVVAWVIALVAIFRS